MCIQWTTSVVATLYIRVNYNYTKCYDYTGNYYRTRSIALHRSTWRTAARFFSLFVHVKTIIRRSKQIRNKKIVRCNWSLRRTTKIYVKPSPRRSRSNLLVATAWIQTGGAMHGFVCSRRLHKTRKVCYPTSKKATMNTWLEGVKCCDTRNMNIQRKLMTRDWWPYKRRSIVDWLVKTS